MVSICVFCGSGIGRLPIYKEAGRELGCLLADKHIQLVYGGARIGLMGTVADATLSKGGEVIGIIPHFLSGKEIAHDHLTQLIKVESMHDRKNQMASISDAFIALPGGIGTLEELFEIFSWDYLKLHDKPIGLLNVSGFYDRLVDHLNYTVSEGFLHQAQLDRLLVANDAENLLQLIEGRLKKGHLLLEKDKT